MKKKSILLLPLILFGMVLAGCHGKKSSDNSGGNSDTPVNPQPSGGDDPVTPPTPGGDDKVAVTSVAVSPSMLSLYVGDSDTLRATVLPENATDSTVTWTSDHTDIATVADGVVTGVAAGEARITATAGGMSGSCLVTVSAQTTPPDPGPGPQPPEPGGDTVPAHTLRIFGDNPENKALTADLENNPPQYKILDLELAENAIFKFKMADDDSDWRGYDAFESGTGSAIADFADDETNDHNVKCLVAGHYDFYVKVTPVEGKSIWVAEHPHADTSGWKVVKNGEAADAAVNPGNDNELQYSGNLVAGDKILFNNGKEASAEDYKEQGYDQLRNGLDAFTKGEHNEITIKEDGAYSFYVDLTKTKGIWAQKDGADLPEPTTPPDPGDTVPAHTLRVFSPAEANHALTANGDSTEYSILNLELAQDATFKFKMADDDSDWRGYDQFKTVGAGNAAANFADDGTDDHNIKVLVAGHYDFYVKVAADADGDNVGKSIWVAVHPEPVNRTGWKAYINDVETAVVNSTDNENQIEIVDLEMQVGDTIIFKKGDAKQGYAELKVDPANGSAHFEAGANGELKALDAGTYNFYVDLSLEKGVWVAKQGDSTPDPEVVPAHTLRVFGEPSVNHALIANAGETEYSILNLELAENAIFKFKMASDDSDWRGYDQFKTVGDGNAAANFADDGTDDHNVKCLVAGHYDFYVKVTADADGDNVGKSIWVAVHPEAVDRTGWKAYINGAETAVINSTDNENQIEIVDLEMQVGDTIIFQKGDAKQGFAQLKDACTVGKANFEAGTNGELKATIAGQYDFFADLSLEKGVWVNKDAPAADPKGHGPEGSTLVSWYIVGEGSLWTSDWSVDAGVQLYSNPSSETDKGCILSVTFAEGDIFKITDGTTWYGYEKVDTWDDPSNKGLHNFEGVSDGYSGTNFRCKVAGSYDIYVNSSGNMWIQAAA